jgi:hypothetical protein
MKGLVLIFLFFLSMSSVFSQNTADSISSTKSSKKNSLLTILRNGNFQGKIRLFSSVTLNEGELSDYYANVVGINLRYETNKFHGFQLGINGYYGFNLVSSDLTKKDPTTNATNRYELGLFDIEDATNKFRLNRLDEMFISYAWKMSRVKLGYQSLNTPLINQQDGRMNPTQVAGIWGNYFLTQKFEFQGGFITHVSPRSTTSWYKVEDAIGINSQGIDPTGISGNYHHHISSKGIAVLGMKYNQDPRFSFQIWDYFLENIHNSIYSDFKLRINNDAIQPWVIYGQGMIQNGGAFRSQNTYTSSNYFSSAWGIKLSKKFRNFETFLAFSRINKGDEFLFPREFGREPFFTFMPRERLEGSANTNAFVGSVNYTKNNWKADLKMGYYKLPNATDFAFNKYGLPSFLQTNFSVKYAFDKFLKGLNIECLLVYKKAMPEQFLAPKYYINKVNVFNGSLVLNYQF